MVNHSKFSHRKHLDGIRGLACLIVILFHCDLPSFSNGFVGVDIFFVLSGFLISSILLREIKCTETLDFKVFYARRFRRLFPASAIALIFTAILYRILELPDYVDKHKGSFIASSLYSQNWYGLKMALDYFTDKGSDQSPVIHFWSLSVEEQFYAFFPIFLFLVCQLFQKNLKFIFTFFMLVLLITTGLNWSLAVDNPMNSYFSTFGRLYQLFTGTIISLIVLFYEENKNYLMRSSFFPNRKLKIFADYLSGGIFLLLLFVILDFNLDAFYLGMLTTMFSFLLIIILEVSEENGVIKKVLFYNRVLCYIGKISYGSYLVHVPMTKFGEIGGFLPANLQLRALVISISTFSTATFLWHVIESPLTKKVKIEKKSALRVILFFLMLTALLPCILALILQTKTNAYHHINQDMTSKIMITANESAKLSNCQLFSRYDSILIAGDSFARAWLQPFSAFRNQCNSSVEIKMVSNSATVYLRHYKSQNLLNNRMIDAKALNNVTYTYLESKRPKLTLFFSKSIHGAKMWYKNYTIGAPIDFELWKTVIRKMFLDFIPYVSNYTTPVFVIEHPSTVYNPEPCIKRIRNTFGENWLSHTNECTMYLFYDRGVAYLREMFSEFKQKFHKFHYIDMGPILFGYNCTHKLKPVFVNGVQVFLDSSHLTPDFASLNFEKVLRKLPKIESN